MFVCMSVSVCKVVCMFVFVRKNNLKGGLRLMSWWAYMREREKGWSNWVKWMSQWEMRDELNDPLKWGKD